MVRAKALGLLVVNHGLKAMVLALFSPSSMRHYFP
jgi:hypothetical protein